MNFTFKIMTWIVGAMGHWRHRPQRLVFDIRSCSTFPPSPAHSDRRVFYCARWLLLLFMYLYFKSVFFGTLILWNSYYVFFFLFCKEMYKAFFVFFLLQNLCVLVLIFSMYLPQLRLPKTSYAPLTAIRLSRNIF